MPYRVPIVQNPSQPENTGFIYKIAAAAPIIWAVPLIAQYFVIGNYWDRLLYERAAWPTMVQAGGYLAFLAMVLIALLLYRKGLKPKATPSFVFFYYAFFFVCAFASIGSISPFRSIAYCMVGASMVWAAIKYWQLFPHKAFSTIRLIAPMILILLTSMILLLGIEGRFIGGNLPNNIGKICYVLLCTGMLWRSSWKYLFMVTAVALTVLLSSRSSLSAMLAFGLAYQLIGMASTRLRSFKRSVVMMALGAVILVPSSALLINTPIVRSALSLDSRDRGFGSGLTGRTDYWNIGSKLISEKPIFGWGFRTRLSGTDAIETRNFEIQSAHSGVINLIVDNGVVGFLLMGLGYVGGILFYIREYVKLNVDDAMSTPAWREERSLLLRVLISYLIGFIPYWFIEPNYLNFGTVDFPLTMLFIFSCLSSTTTARSTPGPLCNSQNNLRLA